MTLDERIEAGFARLLEKFSSNRTGSDDTPPAPPTSDTPPASGGDELAALKAEKAALLEKLSKQDEELGILREDTVETQKAAQLERDEQAIEDLKATFRILPPVAEDLQALAKDHPEAFALFLPVFGKLEPLPQLAGNQPSVDGAHARAQSEGSDNADADRLHHLAKAYQKEHKCSYGEALRVVSRENRELAASVAAPKSSAISEE